ncbi:MAG: lysylphosphatidylglycerol synthase domain-containing protein, partial [Gaiellales bacterium]
MSNQSLSEPPVEAAEAAGAGGSGGSSLRRTLFWRSVLLLITAVSLYALAPSLLEVFSSWRQLATIEPAWLGAMVAFEIASFVCIWELQRIALRTDKMFAVASSQLAGNALGRIVPGGAATAGALQFRMLARAGVPASTAASALLAVTLLLFATVIAMPLLSVPTLLSGASVDPSLAIAAGAGVALFLVLVAGGVALFVWDRPLALIGRGIQWLLNRVRRGRAETRGLGPRLLEERDFIREALGAR